MRIDLLEAFGLELKIINILKRKYGDNLLPLQEKAFKAHQIMHLLAKRPKEMLKREEIYHYLWPGDMNYSGANKPYERQISDHKRKLIAQIRKDMTGKGEFGPQELETLIFTRPKLGYMLNVNKENVSILP